ncbi:hypothetical protein MNEG_4554 [Monoraphidium neglectum]|uniref:Uncharacterized protein n=1 Tax=Monoraphidium neglectum TaxID=145388 RepID=A0A0D2MKB5_9CHLO|nr:hypothetical protein MNEG_4554 [Monoraphidium neglectum]KIZ03405.1 hypothetical protein MNEG_4554 [Monoraphidium neglectum]|eukprot:XP_013902424.1 hypothetical protein MNEG_4554 [Monoraphidium neglectum]
MRQELVALRQEKAALRQEEAALLQDEAALLQEEAALLQEEAALLQQEAALQRKELLLLEQQSGGHVHLHILMPRGQSMDLRAQLEDGGLDLWQLGKERGIELQSFCVSEAELSAEGVKQIKWQPIKQWNLKLDPSSCHVYVKSKPAAAMIRQGGTTFIEGAHPTMVSGGPPANAGEAMNQAVASFAQQQQQQQQQQWPQQGADRSQQEQQQWVKQMMGDTPKMQQWQQQH